MSMPSLRPLFAALLTLALATSAAAQPEPHGAVLVGGGALFADPPAGAAPGAEAAAVPVAMLGMRTFDVILFGVYGQLEAVSFAEAVASEVEVISPTEVVEDYGLGLTFGLTLGFGDMGNTPYMLAGLRGFDALTYTGFELGAGYLGSFSDRLGFVAEAGVVLTEDDANTDPFFVRAGLGLLIEN